MGHGGPDWGTTGPTGTIFTIEDLGELAARLGSPVTFDRRGNVIWMDDFESGIEKWVPWFDGNLGAVEWSSEKSRSGGFSCKLTAGSNLGRSAQIRRWMAYPTLSKMGFEFSFATDTDLDYYYFEVLVASRTASWNGRIQYDYTNKKLQYRLSPLNWVDLATDLDLSVDYYRFNTLKLVNDYPNSNYCRLILNNTIYDMGNIPLYGAGGTASPYIYIIIYTHTPSGKNGVVYVDDVIITQNEP